jgi:hypothetical protein
MFVVFNLGQLRFVIDKIVTEEVDAILTWGCLNCSHVRVLTKGIGVTD